MRFALALLPILFIVAGCSSLTPATEPKSAPEEKTETTVKKAESNPLIGKWVVDPAFVKAHKDADKNGFLTGLATTFWFDFNPDKTFRGASAEGTYVYAEGVVNLITTKMEGKRLEQDGKPAGVSMPGELSKDGKKLTLHPQQTDLLPESIQTGIEMVKS